MSRIQNNIENAGITRIPMRCLKFDNIDEPKREYWDRRYHSRYSIYKDIKRFIQARVGKNIDKVYSEFCSKYPISSHGVMTHDEFWGYISNGDQDEANDWKDFYVDANKCIRENTSYLIDNKERKHIKLCHNGETIIRYKFNKRFIKSNPGLRAIFNSCAGKMFIEDILEGDGTISQKQYDKLAANYFFARYDEWLRDNFNSVDFTFAYKFIKPWRKKYVLEYVRKYRECPNRTYTYYRDTFREFLYEYYDATEYTVVYDKDELKKHFAEKSDKNKKARREYLQQLEEYRENLLHNIEKERKRKEIQTNLIKRDSHGFDENSFIGHPYHGQQRKNK